MSTDDIIRVVVVDDHPIVRDGLRALLESVGGFEVVAEFSCRGHDTFGPLWVLGGLNRKHPNIRDLKRAEAFARKLVSPQERLIT